ncbi:hypothetical protein MRX96_001487 [Rhipicephalus microplus]|uniref:uncharacterized protein LOC142803500 n=1 Tax=Rhipicephalus microplus TaxID=6941 RepID=UPI003F6D40C1
MGTMMYILEKDAASLRESAYTKCLEFGITARDVICGTRSFVDQKQYIKSPYMIYGTFIPDDSARRRVAFAEFVTSPRDKYNAARRVYGSLHHRSALLFYNVHLADVRRRCGGTPFDLIKWICQDFKGNRKCG